MKSLELFRGALDSGKIRKTGDEKISVIDVIEAMTGRDANYSAKIFRRICNQHPAVGTKCPDCQFPGERQRPTPVTDAEGIIQIMMLLPGKRAESLRQEAAKLIVGYLNADIAIADNILQRSNDIDSAWLGHRARLKTGRNELTVTLKNVGIVEPHMYINATNGNYRVLFGKDAKTLKAERGVEDVRSGLNREELVMLEMTEMLQRDMLAKGLPGNHSETLKDIAQGVAGLRGFEGN